MPLGFPYTSPKFPTPRCEGFLPKLGLEPTEEGPLLELGMYSQNRSVPPEAPRALGVGSGIPLG